MLFSCVCPSVCPSQANIVPKWLNLGSRKQRHMTAQGLWFSGAKDLGETPNSGGGKLQSAILTIISPNVRNSARYGMLIGTRMQSMGLFLVTLTTCTTPFSSKAGTVRKRLNRSSWFLAQWLPSTYPTLLNCVRREFGHIQRYGYFILDFHPNSEFRENFATALRMSHLL